MTILAGGWIFQYAMATPNARDLPEVPSATKDRAKTFTWAQIEADRQGVIASVATTARFEQVDTAKFAQLMQIAADAYARRREEETIWKTCEGKEVLSAVSRRAGFADQQAMSQAAFALWSRDPATVSAELQALRDYLSAL